MSRPSGRRVRALRIPVLAIAALVVLATAVPAYAAKPTLAFTVRPEDGNADDPRSYAWLIHHAEPGEVLRDSVLVENLGSAPVELDLYAADAGTTGDGQFALAPKESEDQGLSSWITLEQQGLHLGPGESRSVGLTIDVPRDAIPGDHAGGVVARLASPLGDGAVRTLLAVGSRVYLRVAGPLVEDLRIEAVRPIVRARVVDFELRLSNRGNSIVDVTGRYSIDGLFGGQGTGSIPGPVTILPGGTATIVVSHPRLMVGGRYEAAFALRYGRAARTDATVSFSVPFGWTSAMAVGGIFVFLALQLGLRRRPRNRIESTRG